MSISIFFSFSFFVSQNDIDFVFGPKMHFQLSYTILNCFYSRSRSRLFANDVLSTIALLNVSVFQN